MNNIKTIFSIKDLENLSGIKAHTIRIWEKRYNVLAPMRTNSNIRYYDSENLQKLLNITLLHNHGYKISRISELQEGEIPVLIKEIISDKSVKNHAFSAFKMSMMNFDQVLFSTTYDNLLSQKTFREIFQDIFIPLLGEIGVLWHTNTISPAHEHFISYLIKQKIIANTEKIQTRKPTKTDKVFVLYLPLNEIHELGLMYLNYELIHSGYKTVFLGESVDFESLRIVKTYFENVIFISNMTVEPHKNDLYDYLTKFNKDILDDNTKLWISGHQLRNFDTATTPSNITVFSSIPELINHL